jgi:hypothetical protein
MQFMRMHEEQIIRSESGLAGRRMDKDTTAKAQQELAVTMLMAGGLAHTVHERAKRKFLLMLDAFDRDLHSRGSHAYVSSHGHGPTGAFFIVAQNSSRKVRQGRKGLLIHSRSRNRSGSPEKPHWLKTGKDNDYENENDRLRKDSFFLCARCVLCVRLMG